MGQDVIFAASYAFAVTVQPGPLLTYIVSRALTHGWKRTLPTAFAPVLSDAPIIAVVLLALRRLPEGWDHLLQLGGAFFLSFMAYQASKAFGRSSSTNPEAASSGIRGLFGAVVVNLLNPGPYLGWSLVMGPLLLRSWRQSSALGIAVVASFYGTMVLTLSGIIVLFSFARRLGPRVNRALLGASVLALAGFAVCEFWLGIAGLTS